MPEEEGLILIKLGNDHLTDLVEKMLTPKGQEYLIKLLEEQRDGKRIPHYRHFSRTSQEQQEAFMLWMDWLMSMIQASEENR